MIRILFAIILMSFLSSCEDCNFTIPKDYRQLQNSYETHDTIFFKSANNDFDTMVVLGRDSIEYCGVAMVGKRKELTINIKHLPNSPKYRWGGGTELYQYRDSKIIPQDLITIEKIIESDETKSSYFVGINYRDFSSELRIIDKKYDDYLIDLGINSYWILTDTLTSNNIIDRVTKVIWTTKHGLTEYEKLNGEKYRIHVLQSSRWTR